LETRRIVIDYAPREAFKGYHETDKRYCLTVAHRRAGKTVARINKLIRAAASSKAESPRYGYIAPYYIQAKDIAWNYLKHYAAPITALGGKVNESELSVLFGHNGAQIRLYGAENAERLRGLYFDGIAADEAQDIAPSALTQVILPALADRKGWLDLSGTPKGWGNLLGESYKKAINDPGWYVQTLKASETKLIDQAELDRLRSMMPENEYLQEFECSFDAAITGAYYAAEIQRAQEEGRITSVPYDPIARVNTAWDLGISDNTAIWFYQTVGREIHVIDYLEAAGYGLDYYAKELDKKGYLYGHHTAPHDIEARELGTGKSRIEIARSLGITFKPLKADAVADGITAARMLLPKMWIDAKKCAIGLDALRQYREKRDEKRGVSLGPLHDWSSHAADAFRYLAMGYSDGVTTLPPLPKLNRRYIV
jgi:hypothetical protein